MTRWLPAGGLPVGGCAGELTGVGWRAGLTCHGLPNATRLGACTARASGSPCGRGRSTPHRSRGRRSRNPPTPPRQGWRRSRRRGRVRALAQRQGGPHDLAEERLRLQARMRRQISFGPCRGGLDDVSERLVLVRSPQRARLPLSQVVLNASLQRLPKQPGFPVRPRHHADFRKDVMRALGAVSATHGRCQSNGLPAPLQPAARQGVGDDEGQQGRRRDEHVVDAAVLPGEQSRRVQRQICIDDRGTGPAEVATRSQISITLSGVPAATDPRTAPWAHSKTARKVLG